MGSTQVPALRVCAAEVVPEECQNEVYDFMIVRGKNINANLPLGECAGRLVPCVCSLFVGSFCGVCTHYCLRHPHDLYC
jgi:hypothetical protein